MFKRHSWLFRNIRRAIKDILYDCHSFTAKVGRSSAIKYLCSKGKRSLRALVEYLTLNPECLGHIESEVRVMFGMVFADIEKQIDPAKTGPQKLNETDLWIGWAKKFI